MVVKKAICEIFYFTLDDDNNIVQVKDAKEYADKNAERGAKNIIGHEFVKDEVTKDVYEVVSVFEGFDIIHCMKKYKGLLKKGEKPKLFSHRVYKHSEKGEMSTVSQMKFHSYEETKESHKKTIVEIEERLKSKSVNLANN